MNDAGDMDTLAAEYVLGTLDAETRAQAQALLTVDHALAAKVRIWERRLSELHLMVEPIEPENEIWDRIRRKIPRPEHVMPPAPAFTPAAMLGPAALPPLATPATTAPDPAAEFKPESQPAPALPPAAAFAPATPLGPAPTYTDWDAVQRERPSLESLEEAVLRAADDLQRRATAEPAAEAVVEPVAVPTVEPAAEPVVEPAVATAEAAAGPRPAEADGKTPEAAPASAEDKAKSPEQGPKEAPVTVAEAKGPDDEPSPSGVFDGLPEAKPEPKSDTGPKPADPLAAFPTPFATSAPASMPAAAVPASSATAAVVPPVASPAPAVAPRPAAGRPQPAPRSAWLARTLATLATLILLLLAGLVAAWRFAPERVPPHLQPLELLKAAGIAVPVTVVGPPPRKPAPPESQYEE